MPTVRAEFPRGMVVFASLFSKRIWRLIPVMLAGAILATGRRTDCAVLRVMGLSEERQCQFDAQALLCTDLAGVTPQQILEWFILRWQVRVTFEEVRAHLGVETQRQWSGRAILRTTPALLALYSLITLIAQDRWTMGSLTVRSAAWYTKRRHLLISDLTCETQKSPQERAFPGLSGAA